MQQLALYAVIHIYGHGFIVEQTSRRDSQIHEGMTKFYIVFKNPATKNMSIVVGYEENTTLSDDAIRVFSARKYGYFCAGVYSTREKAYREMVMLSLII